MNVLILAAGGSERLRPLTDAIPKTLLPVGRATILGHILSACAKCGLFEIHVVTGHGAGHVEKACLDVRAVDSRFQFHFMANERHRDLGNVYSLWLARSLFREPLLLINSDVLFDVRLLEKLRNAEGEGILLVDDFKPLGDEEMKIKTDGGRIVRIHKSLPPDSDGEYTGLLKLGPSLADGLCAGLEKVLAESPSGYYEDGLQKFIDAGGTLRMLSTGGLPCVEIDTPEDLKSARTHGTPWG